VEIRRGVIFYYRLCFCWRCPQFHGAPVLSKGEALVHGGFQVVLSERVRALDQGPRNGRLNSLKVRSPGFRARVAHRFSKLDTIRWDFLRELAAFSPRSGR